MPNLPRARAQLACHPDGLHTDVPAAAFLTWNEQGQLFVDVARHPYVPINRHGHLKAVVIEDAAHRCSPASLPK